jgi:lysine 2,3-aminomutase
MPNYLVSASDDSVVLRNFEGMLIRYQAEDRPSTVKPTATRGVSLLLQGTKTALVPENTERMKRRRLIVLANKERHAQECQQAEASANGHGHGETNGKAPAECTNGSGNGNGNGSAIAVAVAKSKTLPRRRKR